MWWCGSRYVVAHCIIGTAPSPLVWGFGIGDRAVNICKISVNL